MVELWVKTKSLNTIFQSAGVYFLNEKVEFTNIRAVFRQDHQVFKFTLSRFK